MGLESPASSLKSSFVDSARALATAKVVDNCDLDYSKGDIIIVIAEGNGEPRLGIFSDESQRELGRYRLKPGHMLRLPIPTPAERPDLEFIDGWIPILFYGEHRVPDTMKKRCTGTRVIH